MTKLLSLAGFEDPETRIGGHTLPQETLKRWCSVMTGVLGESLFRWTRGRVLLPGVSKTTIAFKEFQDLG
ncbi:MAG: hypothetical protein JRJ78_01930 [Deltaproteobacteria bacterium]|nr:hypothetical protein [Deltaproteobacteria bacterium]